MKGFIEEMYYRNFNLKGDKNNNHRICELSDLTEKYEAQLKELLNEEGKAIFKEFLEINNELLVKYGCNDFISGFRMGSQLMMEIIYGEGCTELQE